MMKTLQLLVLFGILTVLCVQGLSRKKRDGIQFVKQIIRQGVNPLKLYDLDDGYGCWCGQDGNRGLVLDELDGCCKAHDLCYRDLDGSVCSDIGPLYITYNWEPVADICISPNPFASLVSRAIPAGAEVQKRSVRKIRRKRGWTDSIIKIITDPFRPPGTGGTFDKIFKKITDGLKDLDGIADDILDSLSSGDIENILASFHSNFGTSILDAAGLNLVDLIPGVEDAPKLIQDVERVIEGLVSFSGISLDDIGFVKKLLTENYFIRIADCQYKTCMCDRDAAHCFKDKFHVYNDAYFGLDRSTSGDPRCQEGATWPPTTKITTPKSQEQTTADSADPLAACEVFGTDVGTELRCRHDRAKRWTFVDMSYSFDHETLITGVEMVAGSTDYNLHWAEDRILYVGVFRPTQNECEFTLVDSSKVDYIKGYQINAVALTASAGDHFGFFWKRFGVLGYDYTNRTIDSNQRYCAGTPSPQKGMTVQLGFVDSTSFRDYAIRPVSCPQP